MVYYALRSRLDGLGIGPCDGRRIGPRAQVIQGDRNSSCLIPASPGVFNNEGSQIFMGEGFAFLNRCLSRLFAK